MWTHVTLVHIEIGAFWCQPISFNRPSSSHERHQLRCGPYPRQTFWVVQPINLRCTAAHVTWSNQSAFRASTATRTVLQPCRIESRILTSMLSWYTEVHSLRYLVWTDIRHQWLLCQLNFLQSTQSYLRTLRSQEHEAYRTAKTLQSLCKPCVTNCANWISSFTAIPSTQCQLNHWTVKYIQLKTS